MKPVLVILVVGLSPDLLGEHTPALCKLAARGGVRPLSTVTPAVTCSAQATLVTGLPPSGHGIVGNGWYDRERSEIGFWKQSNALVSGDKLWERARRIDPACTTAKMFWWYNMYSTADWSATPRPQYPADGRKIPDHYAHPPELHDELDALLGRFPLFSFWGPRASIESSRWIGDATRHVMATRSPTIALTYLPHLDYDLQRFGPDLSVPELQGSLKDVDALVAGLVAQADDEGRDTLVVSEYGITPVTDAVHVNRALREAGLLSVRDESACGEQLDAGASRAFAVADHQVAHVYVNDPSALGRARAVLEALDGVESVHAGAGRAAIGLDHPRAGDLVAISRADRWFSYYHWLDDARAPDYARCVDIHRKPGYDPVELFVDPAIRSPALAAGWRLAKKRLGLRTLMDIIPIADTHLVKGSHGRPTDAPGAGPLVIGSNAGAAARGRGARRGLRRSRARARVRSRAGGGARGRPAGGLTGESGGRVGGRVGGPPERPPGGTRQGPSRRQLPATRRCQASVAAKHDAATSAPTGRSAAARAIASTSATAATSDPTAAGNAPGRPERMSERARAPTARIASASSAASAERGAAASPASGASPSAAYGQAERHRRRATAGTAGADIAATASSRASRVSPTIQANDIAARPATASPGTGTSSSAAPASARTRHSAISTGPSGVSSCVQS